MKIVRRTLWLCVVAAGLAGTAPMFAQSFGVGGAAGAVNDVDGDVEFSGFEWGDANGWFEYKMEKLAVLRLMYGSMWTQQDRSQSVVTTADGSARARPKSVTLMRPLRSTSKFSGLKSR